MESILIPCGRGYQTLHVEKAHLRAVIRPGKWDAAKDEKSAVLAALAAPVASPPLRELARGRKRVLVITSDHTRPVPSRITMPLLLEEIRDGSPEAEIVILIATGLHRSPTAEEIRARFGEEIAEREKIAVHRAAAREEMAFFGILPSGGELWLNRLLLWADLVVSEGFIEPHFFAGFSGGRKSILPGIASEKTVRFNHNAAFIADPRARQGNLKDNPIHRDMLFAAKKANLAFILNVILDENKKIAFAVAGDPEKAHEAGCAVCSERMRAERVEADIAVTSNGGYPLDQNLYQCVKGMTAGEACVRQGGVLIMVAALEDGHGGETFYRWIAESGGPGEVLRDIERVPPGETRFDQWQAQILSRVMAKAACIIVTGEENRALVEKMHMIWAPDADAALKAAAGMVGEDYSVTVIPDGVGVIL